MFSICTPESTCAENGTLRLTPSVLPHCGKFFNRPNSFWESRQLLQPIAGDLCIQSNTKAAFLGANSRLTGLFLLAFHGHSMPGSHFMQTHPKPWLTLSFFFLYKILHPTQNVNGGILTLKVVPTESGGLTGDSGWVNSYLVFVHWRCPLSQALASPLHSGDEVRSVLTAHGSVVSTWGQESPPRACNWLADLPDPHCPTQTQDHMSTRILDLLADILARQERH